MAKKPAKTETDTAIQNPNPSTPLDANDPAFTPETSQATRVAAELASVKAYGTAVLNRAEQQVSGFRQFADAYQGTAIVGQLLRFAKGDWTAGRDETPIELGTAMMVNMRSMMWGYQKWADSKPVTAKWARLAEDEQPIRRADLGDHDQDEWEVDDRGDPRDPWQETMMVLMMDEEGEIYTFATSSKGGLGALARLANAYDRRRRMRPHDMPVVELGADSYKHPVYKKIEVPKLEIIKWTHEDNFADITQDMISSGVEEEVDVGSEEGFGPKANGRGKVEILPPEKPSKGSFSRKPAGPTEGRGRGDI